MINHPKTDDDEQYFNNQAALGAQITQMFTVSAMPTAVLAAMLDVYEAKGISRQDGIRTIIAVAEFLRKAADA